MRMGMNVSRIARLALVLTAAGYASLAGAASYRMTQGKGYTVCEAFAPYLADRTEKNPMVCQIDLGDDPDGFSRPHWQELSLAKPANLALFRKLDQIARHIQRSPANGGEYGKYVSKLNREEWLKESREILHRWTGRTKLRYDMVVSDSVKMLFERGNLNPYLVAIGVEHPDDIMIADIQNPRSRRGIAGLESDLRAIRSVCIREHSDLMIISIPGAPYVNRDAVKYREMGFILPDEVLPGNEMDSLFGSLASHIGASFLGFTDLFRQKSAFSMLFYRFDGHFTALGHHLLGDSLGSFLVKNYFH